MLYLFNAVKNNNIYKLENVIDISTGEILAPVDFIALNGKAFCANLDIAFMDLIKLLTKQKYKNVFVCQKAKQFSFVYKNGECLGIHIKHSNNKELRICNFEKKFLIDFDIDTAESVFAYSISQCRNSYTLGRDAFNEWLQMEFTTKGQRLNINTCNKLFRKDYPILRDSMLDRAKDACSGYQMAKQGYYKNVYNYDISSSYPAQLMNNTPIGLIKEFETLEAIPESYFYIVKATFIDVKIKPCKIDFLDIDGANITTQVLPEHLFKLAQSNYEYSKLKIKRIIAFKTRAHRFNNFVYKNVIQGKIQAQNKFIAKYNKAIANSIVGYFGKNATTTQTKLEHKNGKISIVEREIQGEPVYLPIYIYVTGKAKAEFITTLQRTGLDKIIYANTDGFISNEQINIASLNLGRKDVGLYRLDKTFKEIFIEAINGYCGLDTNNELDNTLSGLHLLSPVSVEQYMNKSFDYTIKEIDGNGNICETIVKS